MSKTIKIDDLTDAVMDAMQDYTTEINAAMRAEADAAAEYALQKVKENSRVFNGSRYANSWTIKSVEMALGDVRKIIHNKKHYQLTHLLEYGHQKWIHGKDTGTRVEGRAHIRPAQEAVNREFEDKVKNRLKVIR